MESVDSFERVLEIGKELPKGSSDPQICRIIGIIVRKRSLSKRLLFLDLVEKGTTGTQHKNSSLFLRSNLGTDCETTPIKR
jgi:hypothetical protein